MPGRAVRARGGGGMGLLSGTASVTRFAVGQRPVEPDFERWAFEEIQPGAEVRERVGFVPFEPGAVYRIGHERWAFRVRCDVVRPDGGAVRERLAQLVATEKEQTGYIGNQLAPVCFHKPQRFDKILIAEIKES